MKPVFFASLLLVVPVATALTTAQTLNSDGTADCRSIKKDKARLACYDALFDPPGRAEGLQEAMIEPDQESERMVNGSAIKTDIPDQPLSEDVIKEREFGEERIAEVRQRRDQEQPLVAVAETIAKDRRGKLIVILHNGQVWRQLPGDQGRIHIGEDNPEIEIKRAALGSYSMKVGKARRRIKVERVK